jgi:hypothetical protein
MMSERPSLPSHSVPQNLLSFAGEQLQEGWAHVSCGLSVMNIPQRVSCQSLFRFEHFRTFPCPRSEGCYSVTPGPYRYIRHPSYAAHPLFLLGGDRAHSSLVTTAAGLRATAATAVRDRGGPNAELARQVTQLSDPLAEISVLQHVASVIKSGIQVKRTAAE